MVKITFVGRLLWVNTMVKMTVFTVVYNGYAIYLDAWLNNLKKQTSKPKEIIVVLGENHGVDVLKYPNVKFIFCESTVMGILRNKAIEVKKYDKCLYFSVDDKLLPNAIKNICKKFNQGFKAVGLKFIDEYILGTKENDKGEVTNITQERTRDSFTPKKEDIKNWRQHTVPGYIAVKGFFKYEEIDIPNYPYLFKLAKQDISIAQTDEIVAIYKRHKNSHGDIARKNGKIADYVNTIDEYAR